jgi:hypothetical protein
MQTSFISRALWALVPATLLLAACGKDDKPAPTPAPDQGKVLFVNAASHIPGASLKFTVNSSDKATLAYGASSGYQGVGVGSYPIQVTSGNLAVLTQPAVTIEKDKNYTFIATPTTSASTVGGLFLSDDLTAPASGKARIRVINLGQGPTLVNPIRLSQVTSTAGGNVVVNIVSNIAGGSASSFTEFTPGDYALSILDNNGVAKAQLGSGTGAGTGTKLYESGKIYTVVVTGTADSADPNQALKAYLYANN